MAWLPISTQSLTQDSPDSAAATIPALQGADLAGVAEPDLAADDLDTWRSEQRRLETDVAASLGFAVGTVKGTGHSRTVVAEFSRSKTITDGGAQARYGVAARLVVNVIGIEANANLNLPFIAAQAEFNQVEAYANLTVDGYVGKDLGKLFPDYQTFNVETYVKLMESLTAMKNVIGADEDNIKPKQLWVWAPAAGAAGIDESLTRAVGAAWALTRIQHGDTLKDAVAHYNDQKDEVARAAIEKAYSDLGLPGVDEEPTDEIRARARRVLDKYELHDPIFR